MINSCYLEIKTIHTGHIYVLYHESILLHNHIFFGGLPCWLYSVKVIYNETEYYDITRDLMDEPVIDAQFQLHENIFDNILLIFVCLIQKKYD